MAETITGVPSLGTALDTRVDTNVWTAAQILGEERLAQPEWLWFDEERTSFGRWSRNPRQAPYVRADIAVASVAKALAAAPPSEALAQAIAAAREEADWQDISTAPRDGTRILLFGVERPFLPVRAFIGRWDPDRAGGSWVGPEWRCIPTHWRPLPAPPTNHQTGTASPAEGGRADG